MEKTEDMKKHSSKEHIQIANKHEKMLNIATHQGNANQNHNKISIHTTQNDNYQKVSK